MRLSVSTNNQPLFEVQCTEEAVYIGSREGCGIRLPDERVAGQQAVIIPDERDTFVLQALDAVLPTALNGVAVADKAVLKDGDQIQIGVYLIRAEQEPAEAPRARGPGLSVAQMNRFVQSQLPSGATVRKGDEPTTLQSSQLAKLARANLGLAACETVEGFMDVALRVILEVFAAQKVWIGVRRVNYGPMEYVEGRHITGQAAELPAVGDNLKPRVLDRGQSILVPHVEDEIPFALLTGPLPGPDGPLGMVYIDTGEMNRRFSIEDLDFFVLAMTLMAVQLDAIFRQQARQRGATIAGEIAVAHHIQARVTPRKLPQWERLQFGAFREPGRERSSDVYDIVKLSNQMAAFMVAHTSAVGPVPSMLMAQAQAAFRTGCMHLDAPHVILRSMNYLMYDGESDHPLNCFVGVIDPNTGVVRYSMAGATGAYIIGSRGDERPLAPAEATAPVGTSKTAAYGVLSEQLKPEESLVVFTPGVTTARNREDVVFGEERFVNTICDGFGQLASAVLREMLSDVRSFTQGGTQPDDITVVLAHCVAE